MNGLSRVAQARPAAPAMRADGALTVGTGCTGIAGFDLGFQRAGMSLRWMMENAKFPAAVLAKRFPDVPQFGDVRSCGAHNLEPVDVFAFGFPCTDISGALNGSHEGIDGKESKLFYSLARIARELRPKWVVIENVPKVKKYMDVIRAELPDWELHHADLTASDFGAYTRRVRTFIVGHLGDGRARQIFDPAARPSASFQTGGAKDVLPMCLPWKGGPSLERLGSCVIAGSEIDPAGVRTRDGLSRGLDRPRYLALGNAVAPAIAEWIGRRIMAAQKASC